MPNPPQSKPLSIPTITQTSPSLSPSPLQQQIKQKTTTYSYLKDPHLFYHLESPHKIKLLLQSGLYQLYGNKIVDVQRKQSLMLSEYTMERIDGRVRERFDRLGRCCEGGVENSSINEVKDNVNNRTNTTRSQFTQSSPTTPSKLPPYPQTNPPTYHQSKYLNKLPQQKIPSKYMRQNTEYGKIIRQKIEGNYSDIQILENRNRNLERMRNIYGCVDRDKIDKRGNIGIGGKDRSGGGMEKVKENGYGNYGSYGNGYGNYGNVRVDNQMRTYSKMKGQQYIKQHNNKYKKQTKPNKQQIPQLKTTNKKLL